MFSTLKNALLITTFKCTPFFFSYSLIFMIDSICFLARAKSGEFAAFLSVNRMKQANLLRKMVERFKKQHTKSTSAMINEIIRGLHSSASFLRSVRSQLDMQTIAFKNRCGSIHSLQWLPPHAAWQRVTYRRISDEQVLSKQPLQSYQSQLQIPTRVVSALSILCGNCYPRARL
jgi:hypothetical protein